MKISDEVHSHQINKNSWQPSKHCRTRRSSQGIIVAKIFNSWKTTQILALSWCKAVYWHAGKEQICNTDKPIIQSENMISS